MSGVTSDWFEIIKQGCVMSAWLFNIHMDRVMKEMKQGIRNKEVHLVCGKNKWWISDLLYADDVAFVAESGSELNETVTRFNSVHKKRFKNKC